MTVVQKLSQLVSQIDLVSTGGGRRASTARSPIDDGNLWRAKWNLPRVCIVVHCDVGVSVCRRLRFAYDRWLGRDDDGRCHDSAIG